MVPINVYDIKEYALIEAPVWRQGISSEHPGYSGINIIFSEYPQESLQPQYWPFLDEHV